LQAGLADDLADILAVGAGLPGHGTGLAALMSVVSACSQPPPCGYVCSKSSKRRP
jgi:hypothetical protein